MDHQSERKKGIERVGGLYDDSQRVWSALSAIIDRDAQVMSYPGLLEIKSGDSVLKLCGHWTQLQVSCGVKRAPANALLRLGEFFLPCRSKPALRHDALSTRGRRSNVLAKSTGSRFSILGGTTAARRLPRASPPVREYGRAGDSR
jgi:hypothetical protein